MNPGGDELAALSASARSGEPGALTKLAKRLLVGQGVPCSPPEGVELLREAMLRGDAPAAVLLSVCAAWGVGQASNINAALDHLARAAELGSLSAQRELQLLANDSGTDWSKLRHKIDLSAWAAVPASRTLREIPRIVVIEHFLSAAECDWLIDRGRPRLSRALVYSGSATARAAESRTNTEMAFTIFNSDVVQRLIRERISAATGTPASFFEIAKLLHYAPGQQFALHGDFLQLNTADLVREVQVRGQRAMTFLVYLNEGFEGGETDFPRIGVRFKGNRGDALLFSNIDAAGAPDYDTVHAGLPPVRGEKWLFSQWIRTRAVAP
jgi:prolyl 4-hydroxylase